MDHARAVVIGGGVGGTSVAYHLAELGWTDVVLVDRAELTSGSTFHSAGLVGQLRSSVTLTRMMMYGVELYRRLAAETGVDPSWHEVGSLRLASTPERLEELPRQAGWAKTFGLPLELDHAGRGAGALPADVDSTACSVRSTCRPTAGSTRPAWPRRWPPARGDAGVRIETQTRVVGIDVEGGRVRGVRVVRDGEERSIGGGGRRQCRRDVRAGDRPAGRGRRADHPDGPPVPVHRARSTGVSPEPADDARPRQPRLLPRGGRRPVHGRLRARTRRRGRSTASRPTSTASCSPRTGRASPRSWTARSAASRPIGDAGVSRMINGPEAFTPDNEFILGESEVRGFFVAAGFCAHGIAGAGGIGRQMASWIVDGEPELDLWKMDIRRFGAQYREPGLHAGAHVRDLRDLLRHPLPERGAPGRPAAAALAGLPAAGRARARRSARSRAGSARTGSSRTPPLGDDGLRPRGWAGSTGRRRSAPRRSPPGRRRACSTSRASPRSRSPGPARRRSSSACAPTTSTGPSARSSTPRCSTGAAGSSATSPSPGWPTTASCIVTGTAFGNHDLGWIRQQPRRPARRARSGTVEDRTTALACFGLWGPRARDILAAAPATTCPTRRSRT